MRFGALALLFGACAVLGGCATIANQGNRQLKLGPDRRVGRTVVPGPTVRAEPIPLAHYTGEDTQIYEGDQQLVVHLEMGTDSVTFFEHLLPCDQMRARFERADKELHVEQFGLLCGLVIPQIWLDTRTPHTLRVVHGGREGTVTIRSRTHWWPWVWVDFLLGPAAPVGLVVDAVTAKWTYFGGSIDVAAVLAPPLRSTR